MKKEAAKRKIGIKYCGGCNPRFERLDMVRRIESALKDRFLFLRYDEDPLDLLLLVSGCPRACASEVSIRRDIPYGSVTQEGDFEGLIGWLKRGSRAPKIPMKATAEVSEKKHKEQSRRK